MSSGRSIAIGLIYVSLVTVNAQPRIKLTSNAVLNIEQDYSELNYFCHQARSFTYLGVFSSARIEFITAPTSYDLYEGQSTLEVKDEYDNSKPNWLPLVPWRSNVIQFPAFETKCVGILSQSPYTFKFRTFTIDYSRLLLCVSALTLFFNARRLVHSRYIFYGGGVTIGVLASLLTIVFLLSRLIPRKKTMLATLLLGWSFSVYIFHRIWTNLYDILNEYRAYLMAYVGISAMVSFAICYRSGPPTNPRTIDLMQWLIQFLSLACVYYSSDIQEVTLAFCVIALSVYNFPASLSAKIRTYVHLKLFRPRVQLLTEEEFYRQGDEVTRLELEKLREYARSPNCNAWKMMKNLKDPQRFGSFVMGESHLEDGEILEYEATDLRNEELTMLTDDDSDTDLNELAVNQNNNAVTSTTTHGSATNGILARAS